MARGTTETAANHDETHRFMYRLTVISIVAVLSISGSAVLGWLLEVPILASTHPAFVPMAPFTAIGFFVLSAALVVHQGTHHRPVFTFLSRIALVLFLILCITIALETSLGLNLDIEQFLFRGRSEIDGVVIGRMSPITALASILSASALLLLGAAKNRTIKSVASVLALLALLVGMLVLLGYLYKTVVRYGAIPIPMALPTALAFVVLGIGIIASSGPDCWPVDLFIGPSIRATLLRALFPPIAIILIYGWVDTAVLPPSFNPALTAALTTILFILIFGAIITRVATVVSRNVEQTELKRRKAEEHFRLIFDSSPTAFLAIVDPEGMIKLANPRVNEVFGYSAEELVGQKVEILVPERFRARHPELRKSFMKNPVSRQLGVGRDLFGVRKDGSEVPIEIALTPIQTDEGTVILTTVTDISVRKEAEHILKESEHRYRSLFENMLEGFAHCEVIFDETGRPVDCVFLNTNRAFNQQTRLTNVVGKKATEVVPGISESLPDLLSIYQRVALSGNPERFEKYIKPLNSWFSGSIYSFKEGNFVAVFDNITDRKLIDEALRSSEHRLRRFYESGLVGVMYWNMNGAITDANDKFLEMTGYSRMDLESGRINWGKMTPPEYVHLDEASILELEKTGVNKTPLEKEYFRKDGTRIPVIVAGAMLDEARFNGVAFVLDNSEQKKTEEQLRKTVQSRDEFISIASHELKTPLTSLLMGVGMRERLLAKKGAPAFSPENVTKMLEADKKQLRRLNRLIEDMLDVSRINSGRLYIEPQKMDLCALVKEVTDRFAVICNQAGVNFKVTLCDSVFGVWDPQRIEQVLLNLLNNALKYGDHSPIEVTVTKTGSNIELRVHDEGRGICKEDQDRIFHRFERAVTGTGITGLGLGLYIVQRIVQLHGGRICVDSDIGRGATFIVELPIRENWEAAVA